MRRAAALPLLLLAIGCSDGGAIDLTGAPFPRLADYGLFDDAPGQVPAEGVLPYDVNAPLFADYTAKHRFAHVPADRAGKRSETGPFELPVGSVLVKTFAMPRDLRDPGAGERLLETRLLLHLEGGWEGYAYVWNEAETEARLEKVGDTLDVRWIHGDGAERQNAYNVPNVNDCKSCHSQGGALAPLGIEAAQLDREHAYADGAENQLVRWARLGLIETEDAPPAAPLVDPGDGRADLGARARSYLHANCAHCHNPTGPGDNAGLDLRAGAPSGPGLGIFKVPVAAGRGSGDLDYGIVPGEPEASILVHRMRSTEPGIAMPELGRNLVDEEGVALVAAWIAAME